VEGKEKWAGQDPFLLPLPSPHFLLFPSLHPIVPLNPARGSGGALKLNSPSGGGAPAGIEFGEF